MNERIRELLVEAREQTQEGKWHAPVAVWAEKFAELIVRECIAVHRDDYGVDIIGDVLKKHFGIEE